MEISIVIPLYKSSKVIKKVIQEIHEVLDGIDFEIILIDDGNSIIEKKKIEEIVLEISRIKLYSLPKNFGQHYAIQYGAFKSNGNYVVSIDDDGQHNPKDILLMRKLLIQQNYDLVYAQFQFYYEVKWRSILRKYINTFNMFFFNNKNLKSSFRIWNKDLNNNLKSQGITNELFDLKCKRCFINIGYYNAEQRPSLLIYSRYTLGKYIRYLLQSIH